MRHPTPDDESDLLRLPAETVIFGIIFLLRPISRFRPEFPGRFRIIFRGFEERTATTLALLIARSLVDAENINSRGFCLFHRRIAARAKEFVIVSGKLSGYGWIRSSFNRWPAFDGRMFFSPKPEACPKAELKVVLGVAAEEGWGVVKLDWANEEVLGEIYVERAAEFHRERVVGGAERTGVGAEVRNAKQSVRRDCNFVFGLRACEGDDGDSAKKGDFA